MWVLRSSVFVIASYSSTQLIGEITIYGPTVMMVTVHYHRRVFLAGVGPIGEIEIVPNVRMSSITFLFTRNSEHSPMNYAGFAFSLQ